MAPRDTAPASSSPGAMYPPITVPLLPPPKSSNSESHPTSQSTSALPKNPSTNNYKPPLSAPSIPPPTNNHENARDLPEMAIDSSLRAASPPPKHATTAAPQSKNENSNERAAPPSLGALMKSKPRNATLNPSTVLPESPINIFAGGKLKTKNPLHAPSKLQAPRGHKRSARSRLSSRTPPRSHS